MNDPIAHVVLFCETVATDGLDRIPLDLVRVVASTPSEGDAIEAVDGDFIRQDAHGRLSRQHASSAKPNLNHLWFIRGAGSKGDEIHAGYGEYALYRIVRARA